MVQVYSSIMSVAKLLKQYHDPENPGSYGGVSRFAKSQGISVKKAKTILESNLSYTLHKPTRRKFPTLPVKVFMIDEQWTVDLFEVINKTKQRLQILADGGSIFSKYAWVEPIKNQSGYEPLNLENGSFLNSDNFGATNLRF